MVLFKCLRQHISGFSYYLDILHHSIVSSLIFCEVITRYTLNQFNHIVGIIYDVL